MFERTAEIKKLKRQLLCFLTTKSEEKLINLVRLVFGSTALPHYTYCDRKSSYFWLGFKLGAILN
jgi:hypothetical protein